MAKWTPTSNGQVGPGESVGRRLFDQPSLVGATDQKAILQSLDYRNFEEQRDGQVSLDRLGKSNPEKAVVNYLVPRAESDGNKRKPPKKFHGWAAIQAKKLLENKNLRLDVTASPIAGESLEENIYHAHAHSLAGHDPYAVALHLKYLFEKHGMIHASPSPPERGRFRRVLVVLRDGLLAIADRLK